MNMQTSVMLAAISIVALAFSGCADEVPSGAISQSVSGLSTDGGVLLDYTPFNNAYPTSAVPGENNMTCGLDVVTSNVPGAPVCTPASSTVTIEMIHLPEPSSAGYTYFLVGPTGEKAVGALTKNAEEVVNGLYMWGIDKTFADEDFTGKYTHSEVRMGDLVVAVTPTAESGTGLFEILAANKLAGFSGTWNGKELTLTVSGLPEGTFTGWLVKDGEGGVKVHEVEFPVTNGEVKFSNSRGNVNDYSEVHIHAAGSKLNFGISSITKQG